MFKKVISIILYAVLGGYALLTFAMAVSSGAIVALIFAGVVAVYVVAMMLSIKASRRLERYKEEMFANTELEIKNKGKILGLSLASNLPYYFIYFALSLLPFDFAALWIVAGLPCCFIAGLRPINQNYQRYNLLTNKGKLYWFIQFVLAAVLWIGGRMIITLLVLGK